jgi:L-amino acid N-acyltransferase YncA
MAWIVRDATPEDAAGVVAVFNPIIEEGADSLFDAPFTVDTERAYIAGLGAREIFKVAVRSSDATIVGFQSMSPFATYTRAFDHVGVMGTFVDRACRRQGIASALFAVTFDAARRKGYEKIFTYIRGDNPVSLATYEKHGFAVVGKASRHAKVGGRYLDVLMVERMLSR